MQQIVNSFWLEFQQEQNKLRKQLEHKNKIQDTGKPPAHSWIEKIVDKIRISELAFENGIEECPFCNYGISFNDNRGWFICDKAKYDHNCSFKGNIVSFMHFIKTGGLL